MNDKDITPREYFKEYLLEIKEKEIQKKLPKIKIICPICGYKMFDIDSELLIECDNCGEQLKIE